MHTVQHEYLVEGDFGKSFVICQTKPYKLVLIINNHLSNLFIRQTFFAKCSKRVNLPNFIPPDFFTIATVHAN